jgi:probable HAF family extracellular repeat protein
MSADGALIAGQGCSDHDEYRLRAFLWDAAGDPRALDGFPENTRSSQPRGISADGAWVVGNYGVGGAVPQAFRWSRAGGMQALPDLAGGEVCGGALDASADGKVIVGWGQSEAGLEAVRWIDGQPIALGDLPGGPLHSAAALVSRDGRVVAGTGTHERGQEAFRWTEAGRMSALGDLPGGELSSEPFGMSPDGGVIVGEAASEQGIEAFRWRADAGLLGLGDLAGGKHESIAFDVSADGARAVGYGTNERGSEAVLWERTGPPRRVQELLLAAGVKEVEGWVLVSAAAISDDGRVIAGHGTDRTGATQAWRAVLP